MKIVNLSVYFIVLLVTSTISAQSLIVKNQIKKAYGKVEVEKLHRQLEVDYLSDIKSVDYKADSDSLFQKEFFSNGNFYQVKRVENDIALYYQTHNLESREFSGVNQIIDLGLEGKELNGENMFVGIIDGDLAFADHIEFNHGKIKSSRLTNKDQWINLGVEDEAQREIAENKRSHATHVLGTIIGKGTKLEAKGMATEAKAIGYNWRNDMLKVAQLAQEGILVSNHSYGLALVGENKQPLLPTDYLGAYIKESAALDRMAYSYPYLQPVVSAGNDRSNYQIINPEKYGMDLLVGHTTSKNAIVVGAIAKSKDGDNLFWVETDFSSYGPTGDLRVKPDIVTLGQNIFSSAYRYIYNNEIEKNNLYAISSGTSMAAPAVSGIILLWQQLYLQQHSLPLKAATVKAVMVNSAISLSKGPNGKTGWGLINASNGVELLNANLNNEAIISETSLLNKETKKYYVELKEPSDLLSFTLSWTDVEGKVFNTSNLSKTRKVLVNDLDIRVIKDSLSYFPWKLVSNSYYGEAIKGDNDIDNIERIDIDFPDAGVYEITVSHKGDLVHHLQDFSLVVNSNTFNGVDFLSIEDIEDVQKELVVWPNPTNDVINIEIPQDFVFEKKELQLFDVNGKNITSLPIAATNRQVVDVSFLARGIYLLEIKGKSTKLQTKIIKK